MLIIAVRDLVDEGVDLRLALARHGDFVRHDDLRDRQLVLLACASSSFIVAYGYFGCPLLRRLVALPLDEPAADRVVLELVEDRVARHQLARHRVGVREVPLGRVVDDVLQRGLEGLVAELHVEALIGIGREAVEERGSTVAGSLPMIPARQARSVPCPLPVALRLPNRFTFSAVAFAS